jgi:hypothetical protein
MCRTRFASAIREPGLFNPKIHHDELALRGKAAQVADVHGVLHRSAGKAHHGSAISVHVVGELGPVLGGEGRHRQHSVSSLLGSVALCLRDDNPRTRRHVRRHTRDVGHPCRWPPHLAPVGAGVSRATRPLKSPVRGVMRDTRARAYGRDAGVPTRSSHTLGSDEPRARRPASGSRSLLLGEATVRRLARETLGRRPRRSSRSSGPTPRHSVLGCLGDRR